MISIALSAKSSVWGENRIKGHTGGNESWLNFNKQKSTKQTGKHFLDQFYICTNCPFPINDLGIFFEAPSSFRHCQWLSFFKQSTEQVTNQHHNHPIFLGVSPGFFLVGIRAESAWFLIHGNSEIHQTRMCCFGFLSPIFDTQIQFQ